MAASIGSRHCSGASEEGRWFDVPEWVTVARTEEVAGGDLFGASVDGEDVFVVKVDDQYRVLGATCTHAGCNLADDGERESGWAVTCLCHGSIFDLKTGEAIGLPAKEPLLVYEVRVEGEEVQAARPGS